MTLDDIYNKVQDLLNSKKKIFDEKKNINAHLAVVDRQIEDDS